MPEREKIHYTQFLLTTFRVPFTVLRYGGVEFLVFLVGLGPLDGLGPLVGLGLHGLEHPLLGF